MPSPFESDGGLPRRGFLAAGAGALLCTIGGERVLLSKPGDAAKADAAARRVSVPRAAAAAPGAGPTEQLTFTTPQPQPGGRVREYWVQAREALWDIVPTRPRRDEWHGRAVAGPSVYRAFVYQQMTEGFAAPLAGPAIPGPTLYAEVGATIVVHFRNGLPEKSGQALTMHPHGVKYNPEYDGVFLGDFTRAGGFVRPGREFTYTWEATPDAVGVWPYHDHGANHTLNTFRPLRRDNRARARREGARRRGRRLFHSLAPPVTNLERQFQCCTRRTTCG
ncbi:MAG TPA: multicopper oxidase domain-containing protein [Solirubrobacteraceae bacterium]